MNIENNWGMNLASGGLSGTAASGVQSMQTGVLSGREKSLFQQMISRMLTEQNPAADGENASAGSQGLLGGNGDLLSALMLQGGSSAGILLQNAGMEAKADVQTDGTAMKNSEAAESLQALMAGIFGAVPVLNPEKGTLEIQSDPNGSNLEIAGAGTILGDVAGNRQNAGVPSTLWKGSAELTGTLTETKTLQAGGAVSGAGQSSETAAQNGNALVDSLEKDSVIGNLDLSQTMAQKSLSDGMQGSETGKSFSLSGIETGRGADGNRASAEIADGGNSKQDSGWLNPDSLGFRNDLSGTAAGKASELTQTVQTAGTSEPYSQIGDEILAKLEQKGPAEFRMQLEPEDLGQIDVKLKFSEGKLMIDILAASAKTQALLTSQVDKLISGLGLQNVHVESVQVSNQANSQAQDSGQGQAFTMHSSMDFSHRRQQEQLQQQSGGGRPGGSFGLRQDEPADSDPMNRIKSSRYDFSRMNYIV